MVHVELIGPYSKHIRQQNPGGAIINNNFILTCMKMIDPATSWFEMFKVPTYEIGEVMGVNDE